MKAVVQERYGAPTEVLSLADVAVPDPAPDEVLVKVHAASVNPADWHLVRGEPLIARAQLGLRRPRKVVPGVDVAGVVEAVGADVTGFSVGDEVYGETLRRRYGTFAEHAAVAASGLAPVPPSLSMEEAAAIPLAGLTALQALTTHSAAEAGRRVLIVGASGGVGHLAVQIAVALEAEVTGVCSTRNVEFARSLGATRVIDYTTESYLDDGEYDLVVQLSGLDSAADFLPVMARDATLLLLTGDAESRFWGPIGRGVAAMLRSPFVSQRLTMFTAEANRPDLERLTAMVEAGDLRPEIERTVGLADVPAAIARVEEAHTRGKVVVTV